MAQNNPEIDFFWVRNLRILIYHFYYQFISIIYIILYIIIYILSILFQYRTSSRSMMFDPNAITTQQSQIQYQQQQPTEKDKPQDGSQKDTFPSFCYAANVNMIHKITPNTTQPHNSTVNMSQLSDDKCYITQPFSYNYALVNQMSLTQNTISNITFKCDVCGLMFAHLSLLNHHKRVHQPQGDQSQPQQQQITVQVQQPQQPPAQIQIVSADRIRFPCEECGLTFNTQTDLKSHRIQSHQPQVSQPQNTLKIKNCESCGAPLPQDNNKKRAVMKVKCENCLSAEAIQPQIFVVATASDSNVKFEESTGTQTTSNLGTQNSIPIGVKNNHPVKRRGVASVTKCTKCNGSGIIFIGGSKNQQNNVDKPFHCNICNGECYTRRCWVGKAGLLSNNNKNNISRLITMLERNITWYVASLKTCHLSRDKIIIFLNAKRVAITENKILFVNWKIYPITLNTFLYNQRERDIYNERQINLLWLYIRVKYLKTSMSIIQDIIEAFANQRQRNNQWQSHL